MILASTIDALSATNNPMNLYIPIWGILAFIELLSMKKLLLIGLHVIFMPQIITMLPQSMS